MDTLEAFRQEIVYLASPYTLNGTSDDDAQHQRVRQVNRAANRLMMMGVNVFSPVTHSHQICKEADLGFDTTAWLRKDFGFLSACVGMYVLMLPDWEQSIGVKREIEFARRFGIPVMFIYPDRYILTGEYEDDEVSP